jgi:hypothetical protein
MSCLLLLDFLTLPQLVYDLIHLSDLILIGFLTFCFLFLHGFCDVVNLSVLALVDDGHGVDLCVEPPDLFLLSHVDRSLIGFSPFDFSFNRLQTLLS